MALIFSLLLCVVLDELYRYFDTWERKVNIFWISIYTLFRQEVHSFEHLTTSINSWFIFWTLGTFILTTVYAGCLYSIATIAKKAKTIDTVEELALAASRNEIVAGVVSNSAIISMIMVIEDNPINTVSDRVFRERRTKC